MAVSRGAEVIRGGQGFSTREVQRGDIVLRRLGGGGGGPSGPEISVNGNTVFVDGQGFSVKPSDQEAFIRSKGGSISSVLSGQIKQSIQAASETSRREIDQQTTRNIQDLHTNFKQSIRGVTDINTRLDLVKNLERDIAIAKLKSGAEKVKAGVIKTFNLFGVDVNKGNVDQLLSETKIEQQAKKFSVISAREDVTYKKDLPITLTTKKFLSDVSEKVKRFFNIPEVKLTGLVTGIPAAAEGLGGITIGGVGLKTEVFKEPKLYPGTEKTTADIETFLPSGKGTLIVTPREKTFYEKFGINPDDKSAIKLKESVDKIQKDFTNETISERLANEKMGKAVDIFTKAQILKGIPANLAIGAALGALQLVPVAGQIAGAAFAADFFLRRKAFLSQLKQFPVESGLATASFIVGGLIGGGVAAGVKSRFVQPNINPQNIEGSVTMLSAKNKNRLISQANNLDDNFRIAQGFNKITDTIAYRIKLKDGRTFQILEFSKLVGKAGEKFIKGEREFFGFEVGKVKAREVLLGKGIDILQGGKGETFIRMIKFKQANSKIGRFIQSKIGSKGQIIDIVQRTKQLGGKGKLMRQVSKSQSEAAILQIKNLKRGVVKQANNILKDIQKGKKISLSKLKSIINLERRASGIKPFTEAEFRNAGFRTLTETQVVSILNKLRLTKIDIFKTGRLVGERALITQKRTEAGFGITSPLKPLIKKLSRIERTPLDVTFAKERTLFTPKIIKGVKKFKDSALIVADKLRAKFKTKSFQKTTAAPAIITGLQPRFREGFISPSMVGASSFAITTTIQKDRTINVLKNRLDSLSKLESRLKDISKTGVTTLTDTSVKNIQQTKQALKLKLDQVQKLKIKRGAIVTTIPKITIPFKPTPFFPRIIGEEARKKAIIRIEARKRMEGYNVFVKSRGKQFKANLVPLSKPHSQSLGSYLVDRSLSAQFRIKKTKKPAQRPKLKFPLRYFSSTQRKFRGKIIKGKEKPIKNIFFERKKYRLDTPTEVKKIHAEKLQAELKRKVLKRIPKPFTKLKKKRRLQK